MTTILVIDDDAKDRELLSAVLQERGYEVVLADNGGTGLMLCHRQGPDAVVLDLRMPELDGRSVLLQLRTLYPSLPVVVLVDTAQNKLSKRCWTTAPRPLFKRNFPCIN
jgi:CheY-like chemotaxis protein